MAHALLPLKDLVAAKTRLAGILSPSERRSLMQAMAQDVLCVLIAQPALVSVTLVSDDPGAAMLAASYGVSHLPEQPLGCRGLNAVLTAACDQLSIPPGERLLVLHADLPFLQASDITLALGRQQQQGGLLIGTDRERRGSNLLLFEATARPLFQFGADSCARHRDSARSVGMPVQVLQASGIARDVDQPRDVKELLLNCPNPNSGLGAATSTLLSEPRLASRLHMALANLDTATTVSKSTQSKEPSRP